MELQYSSHTSPIIVQVIYARCLTPWGHAAEGGAPLRILLTNDDGFSALGIQTLKSALEGAGHEVTIVAPNMDRSGSSAAITVGPVTVARQSATEFAVAGFPATCVFVAAGGLLPVPADLIVSGINPGANIGTASRFSGTVGAVIAGLNLGIPGIAVSANTIGATNSPQNMAHFANVADFAVRLIALLQENQRGEGVLPEGIALNVNYPALPPGEVRGVRLATTGLFPLAYTQVSPGTFTLTLAQPPAGHQEGRRADTVLLAAGSVTIVPLDGDYAIDKGEVKLNFLRKVAP